MSTPKTKFSSLSQLNSEAIRCNRCPRLRRYSERIAKIKRRQFRDWEYWGKPLPGFGDPRAQLLILGLAPAAHGGNRTGRMFTGDGSAEFLMAALHRFKFSNQPTSENVSDGMALKDAYMTAIVRCAPPKNKPSREEIDTCQRYWTQEIRLLENTRIILALGRVAFDTYVRFLKAQNVDTRDLHFKHGAFYRIVEPYPALCASFHPSRQNTQTGKLTVSMLDSVFKMIRDFLASPPSNIL